MHWQQYSGEYHLAAGLVLEVFLSCKNQDDARPAAIVYSPVDSCKALDVNLREWMKDTQFQIPSNENNRDVPYDLLHDNWAK